MSDLEKHISEASKIIAEDFGLAIDRSMLKLYNDSEWKIFCKENGFESNSDGMYIPESNIAYVNKDGDYLIPNVFHELFGHGIYCENSAIGKPLSELKTIEEREKFLYDTNMARTQLFGLAKNNMDNYEGFALWMEDYLCKKTHQEETWKSKKTKLPKRHHDLSEYFHSAQEKLTSFGLVAQMGLPKNYTAKKVLDTLFHISSGRFKDSTIILYGSRKPESDIDLFIISNNETNSYFNGWLDIYELNAKDFDNRINTLDISVTDPLFSGEAIFGDKQLIEKVKNKILNAPIAREMVEYHKISAEFQKDMMRHFAKDERAHRIAEKYSKSYDTNAVLLARGIRILTYKNLQSFDSAPSSLSKDKLLKPLSNSKKP